MIQDSSYEQLVQVKKKTRDKILPVITIIFLVLFFFASFLFLGIVGTLLTFALAAADYFFYLSKVNVEYEYLFVNSSLDVDIIYNQNKRKSKMSLNLREADVICPKTSTTFKNYKPSTFIDFSSQTDDNKVYAIITPKTNGVECVFIEPDEISLNHLKNWGLSKFKAY